MKKSTTFFVRQPNRASISVFITGFFLLVFAGINTLNAQDAQWPTIVWDDLSPRQDPAPMIILGDEGCVYINAKLKHDVAADGVLRQPRITVAIPTGIEFAGTNVGTVLTNSAGLTLPSTFTCTPATISATTREVTFIHNKTMELTDSLVLKVKIKVACNAPIANPGQITVTFSSGAGDLVLQNNRTFTSSYRSPTLRIGPTPPNDWTVNFTHIKDTNWVSIDIKAENGYAKSTLITLAYNGTIVYLDSFKLGNKVLPILASNSGEGVYHANRTAASAVTNIRLGNVLLEGDLTEISRTIKFRATANLGCNWEITPKIQNNLTSNCQTWEENKIVLQMPGTRGAPAFSALNTSEQVVVNTPNQPIIMRTIPRFNMSNPNDLTILPDPKAVTSSNQWYYFCWDGVTPNYGTLAFKNTNGVAATEFSFYTEMNHGANLSICEYIDTTQIYYRVTVPSKLTGLDSIVVPVTKLYNTDRDSKNQLSIAIENNYNAGTTSPTAAQLLVRNEYEEILWNKGRGITLRLPNVSMDNPLPANAKIEFQWVVYANPYWIKDAFRARSSYSKIHASYNNISFRWTSLAANNICNDALSYAPNQYSMILYKPRFTAEALPRVSCYELTSFYYSNPVTTGSNNTTSANDPAASGTPPGIPTGPRFAEVFVKIPAWLNLDTLPQGIHTAFTIRHADSIPGYVGTRPTVGSGIYHGIEDGRKVYSVKYHATYSGVLDIHLIPDACTSEKIVTDTIQTWWDWVSGTPETACHPRFKKTSKVFSIVEFNCIPPALKVDTFGVYRITRGYKDVNNDHNPDDGTLALDNQIQHWHFQQGDTGYFFVKGFVAGSSNNVYDHLVLVLRYGTGGAVGATVQYKWGNTGHTVPFWNQATIEIKRNSSGTNYTFPLDIPVVASQDSIIVYFRGKDMDYFPTGGDSCYLKIPFYCRAGINNVNRGCFYTTTYGIKAATPTLWTNKYVPTGIYKFVVRDFTLTNRGVNNSTLKSYTFANSCDRTRVNELYTYSYYSGTDACNWNNEVRYRHRVEKIELRVPVGFVRTNPYIYVRPLQYYGPFPTFYNTTPTNAFAVIPDLAREDFATQDSIFTIDMTKYYDYEYNGSQGYTLNATTGKLSNGLYPIGDDIGGTYCYFDSLIATPASLRTDLTGTMYYSNSIGQAQTVATQTVNLTYNGRKIYMEASSSVLVFSQMIWSTVDVKNSHGALTNENTWLYVKGNVENAFLINKNDMTDTIKGVGVHNCWLPIGTMGPAVEKNYLLIYSYIGNEVCDNDTITIYSVLDAKGDGYNPDPDLGGIEQVPICNRGPKKFTVLDLLTAHIKIAGYITPDIPNPVLPGALHHDLGYAIDYVINGNVSQGALNDPTITFRIPAGQLYVDTIAAYGAACFEYPAGSGYRVMPPAILAAIEQEFGVASDINTARQLTIHAKDLLGMSVFMMPGWGYTPFGYTDNDRLFKIRIPLVPTCETDLTGIRFRATFNGQTFCSSPCEDDGMQYISPTIFPDITPNYAFDVNMTHIRSSRVFTPDMTMDTLIVTVKKKPEYLGSPVGNSDYLLLRMSENMQIDATLINCIPFGDFTILSNNVNSDGERIYHLSFPSDTLNKLIPLETDTIEFQYRIPIVYNPDEIHYDCSAPRQELECQVVSEAKFSEECDVYPFKLGNFAMKILTLTFDKNFRACLNMPTPLTVACGGVTPVWYATESGSGGLIQQGNTYIYTPTVQKDTSFWILYIYDFNGTEEENMGQAPVYVTMYDQVRAAFELKSSCVGQPTLFENKSKIGDDDSDESNTLHWYWYLNGSTTPFSTDYEPAGIVLQNNDIVKLRVVSIDGCAHETSVTAHPNPLPIPTITGVLDTCWNECVVYKTQTGMTDYQWIVSNGTILGPDNESQVTACWTDVLISPKRGGLRVLYTDSNGCRSLLHDSVPVVVRNPPTLPGVIGDRVSCLQSEATYKFAFQYNIGTYIWTVAGGEIVDGGNAPNGGKGCDSVRVKWTDASLAQITLKVVNSIGCGSDIAIIDDIELLGEVKAEFYADTVCVGETTTLTNLTTIDGLTSSEVDASSWAWYLNNNTTPFAVTKNAARVFNNGDRVRLHVVSPDGCVRDTTVTIAIHALPTPTVTSGSLERCLEECSTYVTQTGQQNYHWSVTNGTIDGDDDAASVAICWDGTSGSGTITVQYTDEHGCTDNGSETVVIHAKPAAPIISGEGNPCVNIPETYTYTTTAGMNTYQWTIVGGEFVGSTTGNTVSVKWTSTGTGKLAVNYKNNYGCLSYPMTDTLKPNVKPNVLANQIEAEDETVCIGNTATLTATTDVPNPTFLWYETQTSNVVLFTGDEFETGAITSDTSFFVSVYGTNYCENLINTRKEVRVTINQLSVAGVTSNDTTICYNTGATVGIKDYTGTVIQWQDSINGVAFNNISATTATFITDNLEETTWFRAIVTNGVCEPVISDIIEVTVNDYATTANIGIENDTICTGTTTMLTATSTGVTAPIFHWYASQTAIAPFFVGAVYTTSALTADSTFYIGVSGSNLCENLVNNRKPVTVKVNPYAEAAEIAVVNDTICTGETTSVTPTADGVIDPVFRWYASQSEPTHFYQGSSYTTSALTADTTLYISVLGVNFCENNTDKRKPVTITVNAFGIADDIYLENDTICMNKTSTLEPLADGVVNPTFRWYTSQTEPDYFYEGDSFTTDQLLTDTAFYVSVFGDNRCENLPNSRKEVKVIIKVCKLIDCDDTAKSAIEDGCAIGFYTQIGVSWDIMPLPDVVFDSTRYFVNNVIQAGGVGASLRFVHFTVKLPILVEAVAYYKGITDTCRFNVRVDTIPFATKVDLSATTATICAGTSALLKAASTTITNPTFRWYETQTSMTVLYEGANYITNPLFTDTMFYVSVLNETNCENTPIERIKTTVKVVPYPVAPQLHTEVLPAFRWMPVDLSAAVDIIPELIYTYYENPDGTGKINGSIVTFNPPKNDYYVTAGNNICESEMSQIILIDPCPESVDDEEGNTYKVTSLGGFCWTENLKSTQYVGGAPIAFAQPYTCPICPSQLENTYGLLYDWYSAVGVASAAPNPEQPVQGICPDGWRIPTVAEWGALAPFPATKLQSTQYWIDPPGSGTDDYGFDARPAGWFNGVMIRYQDMYGYAGWWASDAAADNATANSFYINYACGALQTELIKKIDGLSVRCVLDY